MNGNANVEWWDANKLHQHYNDATAFDDGSTVRSRAPTRATPKAQNFQPSQPGR